MQRFFAWAIALGIVGTLAPVVLTTMRFNLDLSALLIVGCVIGWCVVQGRTWYLYGPLSLWLLTTLPLVLPWPALFFWLWLSCTFSNNCL